MVLSVVKTVIIVILAVAVLAFLIFDNSILRGLIKKINDAETESEIYDVDIPTANKIYTYKLTGTNNYKRQDAIKKSKIGTKLDIKKVKPKDGKDYFSVQYHGKEIGVIAKTYLDQVIPDIFKGVDYECILSKRELVNNHFYAYIKLYKVETTALNAGFDRSDILRKIPYRVGDHVLSKAYGVGEVVEIRVKDVIVKFKDGYKVISDLASLTIYSKKTTKKK